MTKKIKWKKGLGGNKHSVPLSYKARQLRVLESSVLRLLIAAHIYLTISVPVSYQHLTSPYIPHKIRPWYDDEKMRIQQTKLTIKLFQTVPMKGMTSSWENLTTRLGLKGLGDIRIS